MDKTTKSRIENARICLARRLARLTPSQVATLSALHPGKHAGFHGIVKITTNSRFHVENPRAVASPSVIPPRRLEWREVPGILDPLIEIQMSISRRYEHILPNEREAKRGAAERNGGGMNAECFSCLFAMSKTVAGSRPCLLSNSVRWTRISSSKVARPFCPSVLFYSHIGHGLDIRFSFRTDLFSSRPRRLTCRRRGCNRTKNYKNTSAQ